MIQRNRLMELMSYDPATGQFVWLIGRRNHRPAGSEAGYRRKDGYIVLVIEGKHYLAHRIAWFYMTGRWPMADIDHKDGDPSNNCFSNLREANRSQNTANSRLSDANTSGFKGVSFNRRLGKWEAYITKNRRRRKLGYFTKKSEAVKVRRAAEAAMFGEFVRTN